MKHTLLSTIAIFGLSALSASAQYAPVAGSTLASGTLAQAGYSQTITATIPTSSAVTGQQILDLLPASVAPLVASQINAGTSYPVTVTSTRLSISGVPAGLSEDCGGCTVNGGSSRDIVISGSPSVAGTFTVDITSETTGSTTISGFEVPFGGSVLVGPIPVDIPSLSSVLDAEGYTLFVDDPNGIEESNEVFALNLFPNPTQGITTLNVNSTIAGVANIEVYSITGALVQSSSNIIRVGANRVNIDLQAVPAGIYLVKADINGTPALIRMQKI